MSSDWINWRLFYWHLQIGPTTRWVRFGYNPHHVGRLWWPGKPAPRSPWVEFY